MCKSPPHPLAASKFFLHRKKIVAVSAVSAVGAVTFARDRGNLPCMMMDNISEQAGSEVIRTAEHPLIALFRDHSQEVRAQLGGNP
jgi:hypothetical protein